MLSVLQGFTTLLKDLLADGMPQAFKQGLPGHYVRGVEEVSLVFFNFILYFCIMVYFPFLFFNSNMHCSA